MDKNTLSISLVQQVENHQVDLTDCYHRVLRANLFENRAQVRPAMLKGVAADEVKSLLDFLRDTNYPGAARGDQLCQLGLGEQSVLCLGQSTRQFFLKYLENGHHAPALDLIDLYYNAVIQGYIRSLEKNIFEDQERTRHAFIRVMNRSNGKGSKV